MAKPKPLTIASYQKVDGNNLAEAFAGLRSAVMRGNQEMAQKIARHKAQQAFEDRCPQLMAMGVPELRALWDRYDGCNSPDGWAGEDIHLALNLKGDGHYCAV